MKTYVTFGQAHRHEIGGKVFDKDCVAVIEGPDAEANRARAFDLFGPQFCFEYPEPHWNEDEQLRYFPRGYVGVDS